MIEERSYNPPWKRTACGAVSLQFHPIAGRRQPALFLDRDGVINERVLDGYVTRWTEFHFLDAIVPVLRELNRLKLPLILASNQSGVGKGVMTLAALREITLRFVARLEHAGAVLHAAYYCPHAPWANCLCRKPRPGLLRQAARDLSIDLAHSVMIGDAPTDIAAGRAAGCRGILLDWHGEYSAPAGGGNAARPPFPLIARRLEEVPALAAALLDRTRPTLSGAT